MKKGITILIAAMVIVGTVIGVVTAEDYDIVSESSINGTGSFDITLKVQTELDYMGKSLTNDFYTKWMGTDGDSDLRYNSALEVFMGNSSEFKDKRVTEIDIAETALSSNGKQRFCMENYDAGVSHGFTSNGNLIKSFEGGMLDNLNEFEIEGSVYGRMRLMQKVVDPVDRTMYLNEDIRLDGKYDFMKYMFAEKISFPEGDSDWLGCP